MSVWTMQISGRGNLPGRGTSQDTRVARAE